MTFSNKLGTSYSEGKNQSILARIEPNFDPYHHFLQRKPNKVTFLHVSSLEYNLFSMNFFYSKVQNKYIFGQSWTTFRLKCAK